MIKVCAIALIGVYLLVALLLFLAKKEHEMKNKVCFHIIPLILGIFALAITSIYEIGCILAGSSAAVFGLVVFVLPSASLIFAYCNCRLYYYDTYVIRQNFFRIRKRIDYDDFISIKKENGTVIFRTKRGKIKISQEKMGKPEFFKVLKPYKDKIQNLDKVPLGKVPKVIRFKDAFIDEEYVPAVIGLSILIFLMIASLGLMCFNIFFTKQVEGVIVGGIFSSALFFTIIATFVAAKRHHSSKFWAFVAKYAWKKGVLKDPYQRKQIDPWANV